MLIQKDNFLILYTSESVVYSDKEGMHHIRGRELES